MKASESVKIVRENLIVVARNANHIRTGFDCLFCRKLPAAGLPERENKNLDPVPNHCHPFPPEVWPVN